MNAADEEEEEQILSAFSVWRLKQQMVSTVRVCVCVKILNVHVPLKVRQSVCPVCVCMYTPYGQK